MSAAAMRGVVRWLGPSADPPLDADLVTAFAARRDADAFAALVDRHGPTVLGVCRRVLGDAHEAEDAFQVVFLVLAQKVKAVRPPGAVGGWLYGVAVRTANKARVATARRRRREMIAASNSASRERKRPEASRDQAELQTILDAELARLPESLRAAIVLCDLQGKTRTEAAAELKCPEGTVAARLHRGRKKLADALSRRGLALPTAGLAAVLTPAAVSASASRSAVAIAFGSASPAILALAREVTRSMTTTIHAIALGTMALIAGGLLAAGSLGTNDPAPPPRNLLVETKADKVDAPKPNGPWKEATVLEQAGWLAGSVAFSGDGKSLFVGGTGGHAFSCEAANWKKLWEYKGNGPFSAVACAPDDKTVAVTFKEGTSSGVRFLDAKTGRPGGDTLEEENVNKDWPEPLGVACFPDSVVIGGGTEPVSTARKLIYGNPREYLVKTWLVGGKPSTIHSSVTPSGKEPADAFAVPLAVDPNGKRVVVTGPIDRASGKNILWAWSAGSGQGNKLLEGHKAVVVAAAWSKDGNTIVTGDVDGVVITWDASTFKEKSRLTLAGRIAAVAISADGKHTAAAVAGRLEIVKKDNYQEEVFVWPTASPPAKLEPISRHQVGGPFNGVASIAFAPDGQTLVSAFCNFDHLLRTGRLVGRVRIFKTSEQEPQPAEKSGYVQDVRFSPDGSRYVVSPGVTVHDKDGRILFSVAGETAGFSANGKTLFVMGRDKMLECDADTGKVLKEHPRPKTKWGWHIISFAPDGKHYAAHFGFNVRIYDTATGFEPLQLDNQHEPGSSIMPATVGKQLIWSPDGKQVIAVGVLVDEGKVGLAGWDVENGKRLYSFAADFDDGPRAAAFSADSKTLAIGYEKHIDLWSGGLNRVKKLSGQGPITALAFSPDKAVLAAGIRLPIHDGADKPPAVIGHKTEVRLLDIGTDKVIKVLDGFEGVNHLAATKLPVIALAFTPNGKTLFAGTGIVNMTTIPADVPKSGEVKRFEVDQANDKPLDNTALRKFQGDWKLNGFSKAGGNKLTGEAVKALGWTLTTATYKLIKK